MLALLLTIVECNLRNVQTYARSLFGFMFTYTGRTLFLFL